MLRVNTILFEKLLNGEMLNMALSDSLAAPLLFFIIRLKVKKWLVLTFRRTLDKRMFKLIILRH